MAYIDKMIVEGTTYDLGVLESLKDKNGHNRFIEGAMQEISSPVVTLSYKKWSLSGTHIMFVIAGTCENASVITANTILAYVPNLPTWVINKIFPVWNIEYLEKKNILLIADDGTTQELGVYLRKAYDTIYIYSDAAVTLTANRAFRMQFDLLIDTD